MVEVNREHSSRLEKGKPVDTIACITHGYLRFIVKVSDETTITNINNYMLFLPGKTLTFYL